MFPCSTLLHLPPLRFHSVKGCWDRTQRLRHWQSDALTTRLDLIHTKLDLNTLYTYSIKKPSMQFLKSFMLLHRGIFLQFFQIQTIISIFSCLFVIPSHIDNEENDCLIPFQIYFLTLYRNFVSLILYEYVYDFSFIMFQTRSCDWESSLRPPPIGRLHQAPSSSWPRLFCSRHSVHPPPPPPHCNENPIYVFPEKEFRGPSPNSYIHMSVNDLYIPRIGSHTIWQQQNRQNDPENI